MREKFMRFMQGRYGIDQLSKFILVIGVVCVLISALFGDHPAALVPYFLGWITWAGPLWAWRSWPLC